MLSPNECVSELWFGTALVTCDLLSLFHLQQMARGTDHSANLRGISDHFTVADSAQTQTTHRRAMAFQLSVDALYERDLDGLRFVVGHGINPGFLRRAYRASLRSRQATACSSTHSSLRARH